MGQLKWSTSNSKNLSPPCPANAAHAVPGGPGLAMLRDLAAVALAHGPPFVGSVGSSGAQSGLGPLGLVGCRSSRVVWTTACAALSTADQARPGKTPPIHCGRLPGPAGNFQLPILAARLLFGARRGKKRQGLPNTVLAASGLGLFGARVPAVTTMPDARGQRRCLIGLGLKDSQQSIGACANRRPTAYVLHFHHCFERLDSAFCFWQRRLQ